MIEKERNKNDSKKLKREKSLSVIEYNQILETENINTQTQASQKVNPYFKNNSMNQEQLAIQEMEITL
jgi:hypothetical protein